MSVRRISILLILVLATSAFGCATGYTEGNARLSCIQAKSGKCPAQPKVKSARAQCSLRSLAQFHYTKLPRFEVPSPLRSASGKTAAISDSTIHVSSIGSPETDRGPPLS